MARLGRDALDLRRHAAHVRPGAQPVPRGFSEGQRAAGGRRRTAGQIGPAACRDRGSMGRQPMVAQYAGRRCRSTYRQTRPHCPDDYLIKITAVGPDASCSIPIWTNFLDRVTGGDTELSAFIGRILGYALTGVTHEHAMFFAYGSGANGKSVLTATAAGILGDYHTSCTDRDLCCDFTGAPPD